MKVVRTRRQYPAAPPKINFKENRATRAGFFMARRSLQGKTNNREKRCKKNQNR